MYNRNLKDGLQTGRQEGGRGFNQTDECRHLELSLPYFPSPGPEIVIDEPGYFKGYFCNYCPESNSPYEFKVPTDWEVLFCSYAGGLGSHGCCVNCKVVLIELEYVGSEIEVTENNINKMLPILVTGLGLIMFMKSKRK